MFRSCLGFSSSPLVSCLRQFWSPLYCLKTKRFFHQTSSPWVDNGREDNRELETRREIPVDRLTVKFARSSGPGGQNVNKVSTKVDIRFHVPSADWLPERVRNKLLEREKNRVNKNKELVVSSTKFRTQQRNLEDAVQKIQSMIAEASYIPKGPTAEQKTHVKKLIKAANERRLRGKKFQSIKKRERQGGQD